MRSNLFNIKYNITLPGTYHSIDTCHLVDGD
jgi:hypothetical protein